MAAVSGPADHTARTAATAAPGAAEFRWRRVFPGDPRQLGELRHWLAALLPADPARDDVVSMAVEFDTNAIKFPAVGGPCLAPGADPDPHVLEDFNHG